MTLRVLLVEPQMEDVLFIQDVLTEIESGRYWNGWVPIETLHASTMSAALAILTTESVDVILLNPDLSDCQGMETFRRIHACRNELPVVLLVGPEDAPMATRLVRDGAQDFLVKRCVDCAPLAYAMRNAIERQRLLSAAQASSRTDPLTGLTNRGGFLALADRDRKLAERLGRRLMILIAEPANLHEAATPWDRQRRDLALVEAADHLRSVAGPTDVIARIGERRFGMAVFETDVETLEEAWVRMHSAAVAHRMQIGAAIFAADRPAAIDALLEQAAADLNPAALAMQT
ncbi:MAG TPA: response regulator [Bryobacteraceae bacterium]|nr:response regulator [Bryobacteraceae bacterium]